MRVSRRCSEEVVGLRRRCGRVSLCSRARWAVCFSPRQRPRFLSPLEEITSLPLPRHERRVSPDPPTPAARMPLPLQPWPHFSASLSCNSQLPALCGARLDRCRCRTRSILWHAAVEFVVLRMLSAMDLIYCVAKPPIGQKSHASKPSNTTQSPTAYSECSLSFAS